MNENPFSTISKCKNHLSKLKDEKLIVLTILKSYLSIKYLKESKAEFKKTLLTNSLSLSKRLFNYQYLLKEKSFDTDLNISKSEINQLYNIITNSNISIHPDIFTLLFEMIPNSKNKDLGQVFTPIHITRYILKHSNFNEKVLSKKDANDLTVIDPAMGYGKFIVEFYHVLKKTFLKKGMEKDLHKKIIERNIYGIDKDSFMVNLAIIYLLTLKDKEYYSHNKLKLNLIEADALMQNNSTYFETLESHKKSILTRKYDYVLGNPPYSKKFSKKDKAYYIKTYSKTIGGHPNLCTLFIHRSIQFLKDSGYLGYIVAAPYTTGTYNTKVRKYIIDNTQICELLLFKDRKKTIRNVLQAFSIIILKKEQTSSDYKIKLTEIEDLNSLRKNNIKYCITPKERVLFNKDYNYMFLISANKKVYDIIEKIRKNSNKLIDFCKQISTGHIVNFRVKEKISSKFTSGAYPLIDIKNVYSYYTDLRDNRICPLWYKPVNEYDKKIKMCNGVILVKRMTSPEQKKRIVAGYSNFEENNVYLGNKTNFINIKNEDEINPFFLTSLLNSKLFDFYFRKFSSNTQVSANELRLMPIKLDINGNKEKIIGLAEENRKLMQQFVSTRNKSLFKQMDNNQQKIDNFIYEIYDLNPEEINAIQQSYTC